MRQNQQRKPFFPKNLYSHSTLPAMAGPRWSTLKLSLLPLVPRATSAPPCLPITKEIRYKYLSKVQQREPAIREHATTGGHTPTPPRRATGKEPQKRNIAVPRLFPRRPATTLSLASQTYLAESFFARSDFFVGIHGRFWRRRRRICYFLLLFPLRFPRF